MAKREQTGMVKGWAICSIRNEHPLTVLFGVSEEVAEYVKRDYIEKGYQDCYLMEAEVTLFPKRPRPAKKKAAKKKGRK